MGLILQAVFFFPILKHGQGHVLLQKPWLLSGFKDPWRHTPIRNVWEYPPPSPERRVITCRRTLNPLWSPPSLIPPPPLFRGGELIPPSLYIKPPSLSPHPSSSQKTANWPKAERQARFLDPVLTRLSYHRENLRVTPQAATKNTTRQ